MTTSAGATARGSIASRAFAASAQLPGLHALLGAIGIDADPFASGDELLCVYKPVSGERPLWDFPDGTLAGREVSAYLVSAAIGWDLVPPTVLRERDYGARLFHAPVEGQAELFK